MSESTPPTIGRIVHYTNLGDRDGKYPPEVQAALITGVNEDGTVSLHVFYRTGQFNMPSVEHTSHRAGTEDARGRWSWPVQGAWRPSGAAAAPPRNVP